MSLSVAFRTDASVRIGTGHVMRCLTLAAALASRGHACRFVCRDLPGHLGARIEAEGHALTLLPAPPPGFEPAPDAPAHAVWAGVSWQQDAPETRAAAQGADVLVVDHYAFDARWEAEARPPGARLVVLDDLADRPHLADLLLDQNLGRQARDYDGLLPPGAERLIGPRYALLRPAFAQARPAALAARAARGFRLERVLVTMGGVDLPNATGKVLSALATRPDLQATVVMGAAAPALDAVQAQAAALPTPARVLVDVNDMAGLMAEADLAIGAAGGTAWERCTLGLPTLIAVLADNQDPAAQALERAEAAISLGRAEAAEFGDRVTAALAESTDPVRLSALSAKAAGIADGKGTGRVADAMEMPLPLRPAAMADAEAIWHWRQSLPPEAFRAGPTPPLADHLAWFASALDDPGRKLYVAGDPAYAHLRLDFDGTGGAAVSILLAPSVRGKGLGNRLLGHLMTEARLAGLSRLTAEVHCANAASHALFTRMGFQNKGRADAFERFALTL